MKGIFSGKVTGEAGGEEGRQLETPRQPHAVTSQLSVPSCFFFLDLSFFLSIFVLLPFPLCVYKEYVVRFPFRVMFFYLVTTAWSFDISLCGSSINQMNKKTQALWDLC